jgi:hypothetical protein
VPSDEDILKLKNRSIGVCELDFKRGERPVRVVDVGGSRSNQKKWRNAFQNVQLITILVSFAKFGHTLPEDVNCDAWDEQRSMIRDILGSKWFRKTECLIVGTHFDCLEKDQDPLELIVELLGGPAEDEKTENMQNREGRISILPDCCLTDIGGDVIALQIESAMRVLCGEEPHAEELTKKIEVEGFALPMTVHLVITKRQRQVRLDFFFFYFIF